MRSSPRRRGPIRGAFSISCGVLGPRFRWDDGRELANAAPPVLFEAPGRPPSIPLSRGQVSPPRQFEGNGAPRGAPVLRNPRCLLDSAGASRRSIGGVLPSDAGSALCVSPLRLAFGRDRDPLRVAAGSVSRANLGGSASASSWQGVVSAPGRSPASPECRLTRPARGRRIHRGFCTPAPGGRAPHLRHRPFPAAPPSGSSLDDAPHRAGRLDN